MADSAYLTAMRNPILQASNSYISPDTRRFTLEEEYNKLISPQSQQPLQSDPYSDYVQILNSCTDITKEKILRDERFGLIYAQCEGLLKEYLYAQIIPQVLQSQQGRIVFEQLFNVTKSLKEEYVQLDLQKEKQLELLMQDEVVLRRLKELQEPKQPTRPAQQTQSAPSQPPPSPAPPVYPPVQQHPQQPPQQEYGSMSNANVSNGWVE